jgi:hypothetical protein
MEDLRDIGAERTHEVSNIRMLEYRKAYHGLPTAFCVLVQVAATPVVPSFRRDRISLPDRNASRKPRCDYSPQVQMASSCDRDLPTTLATTNWKLARY